MTKCWLCGAVDRETKVDVCRVTGEVCFIAHQACLEEFQRKVNLHLLEDCTPTRFPVE